MFYIGNGAVSVFPFSYLIVAPSDLLVAVLDLNENETTLMLGTDYTVSNGPWFTGGSITLTAGALTSGYKISIRRVRPLIQNTDIRNQGSFYPNIYEDALDNLTMIGQQHEDEIERSFKLPETFPPTPDVFDPTFPWEIFGAPSAVLTTNEDGTGLAIGPALADISQAAAEGASASASAAAALASANAAAQAAAAAEAAAGGIGSLIVAPTIVSVSPGPGNLTAVPTTITVTFSQAMKTASTGGGIGNPANWSITPSAGSASISSIAVTASTAILTITSSGITSGTTFAVAASPSIASVVGLTLIGTLVTNYTYLPVQSSPTIVSWSPAAGNVGALPTTVVVTFSAPMDPTTTTTIANWAIGASSGSASIIAIALSSNVATLTISTAGVPAGGALTISGTSAIKNVGGSLGLAGALSEVLTLVPPTSPTISSTNPRAGATVGGFPLTIVVTFSQAMNTSNVGGGITNPANWGVITSAGGATASISSISATPTTATLTIASTGLPSGDTVTLTAEAGLAAAGGAVLGTPASFTFNYITGGLVLPTPATPTIVTSAYSCRGQGGGGAYSNYSMSPYNGVTFTGCDGSQLIRSPDGVNFFPCPQSVVTVNANFPSYPPMSVGFASDGATCFYAPGGVGPLRSTDGGITWPAMTGLTLTGGEQIKYWVNDSYNPLVVFCGTTLNLYGSTDGGITWALVKAGFCAGTFIDYTTSTTRTIYHAHGTQIFQALNWTIASGLSGLSFSSWYTAPASGIRMMTGGRDRFGLTLAYVDTDSGAAAAQSPADDYTGNFGYVWLSTPATPAWTKSTQGGGLFIRMAENDSQTIYTCGGTGSSTQKGSKIWQSGNAGISWSLRFLELNQSVSPFAPWPADKLEYNSPGIDIYPPWPDDVCRTMEINLRNSAQLSFTNNFFCFRTDNFGANWKSPFTNFVTATGSDSLLAGFTMPSAGGSVTIGLNSGSALWLANSEYIFIAGAGYFQITSFPTASTVALTACQGGSFTGTLTSGSNVIGSPSSLSGLMPGCQLQGTGIPGTTFVGTVTPTLTMTKKATASGTVTISQNPLDKYVSNASSGTAIPVDAIIIPARLQGMRWSSTGLENTTILRFKFHPSNNAVAYAACSDQGGIATQDAGVTFYNCSQGDNTIYDYAFDPTNDQTVFCATGGAHDWPESYALSCEAGTNGVSSPGGGISKSSNRGLSWASLTGSGTWNRQFLCVAYDQVNNIIYGGTQGGGIAKSTDGGATWSTFNVGLSSTYSNIVSQIEVDPSNQNVYCLVSGNAGETNGQTSYANNTVTGVYLWNTVASATSWSLLRTTVNRPSGSSGTLWYYPVRFALDYTTRSSGICQTIWMADIEVNSTFLCAGVWKTVDGGSTWNQSLQYNYPRDLMVDSTAGRVYAAGLWFGAANGNGGQMVTKNGGSTWAQNTTIPLTQGARTVTLDPNHAGNLFYGFLIGGFLYGPRPA